MSNPGMKPAPEEVFEMLACKCLAQRPCLKGKCCCRAMQLSCTIFCKCLDDTADEKAHKCSNPFTVHDTVDVRVADELKQDDGLDEEDL